MTCKVKLFKVIMFKINVKALMPAIHQCRISFYTKKIVFNLNKMYWRRKLKHAWISSHLNVNNERHPGPHATQKKHIFPTLKNIEFKCLTACLCLCSDVTPPTCKNRRKNETGANASVQCSNAQRDEERSPLTKRV